MRRLPISEPLIAVGIGIAIGPAGAGLVDLDGGTDPLIVLEQGARITLAIGLMGVALRLPLDDLRASWRSIALLIGLLMPVMWLVTGALAWLVFGLPALLALLLGAILTPTDPIVASTIVTGEFVERRVPARIRRIVSAESGFNDGLAVPFVLLPLLALGAAPLIDDGWLSLAAVLWKVVGALLIGTAAGAGAGWLLREAHARELIEVHSLLAYTLALSLCVLGGATLLGAEGILAVFIAGLAFDAVASNRERVTEERVQEAINRFFIVPVFVLFGIALPWSAWAEVGWVLVPFAAAVLLLRRLPALLLMAAVVPDLRFRHDALFVGWFGPIGVAAIYYATLASRQLADPQLWAMASAVIAASIVAHGITADPFIRLYASAEFRRRARGQT